MGIISENIMHRVEEFGMCLPEQVNKSVIPHRNYENCNIYWCECGWFLRDKDRTPIDFIADLYKYTTNLILTYDEDEADADGERKDDE